MFEYCPHDKIKCAHCGTIKDVLHCGRTGEAIANMKRCPERNKGKAPKQRVKRAQHSIPGLI
jgi:hypothetical protein